jgi:outer membrane biogenesis lipoprotein LolB
MKGLKIVFATIILLMVGCKSAKNITSSGELDRKISSKQIIKEHSKQEAKFKTLQSRVKVEYIHGNNSQAHTINLRIEKDKTIWLSGALGVVRAKITPTTVSFYNKLDHTYFDGDFTLISDLLGTELDFDKVQNLLLGESLFDLKTETYNADIHEMSYLLQPKDQSELLEIFLLLNPAHFKMDSQQLAQPLKRRMLQVDYKDYQEVEKQILPQNIKVIALEGENETIIAMEFKSISLNNELRFPFRIPSGFEEIVIR